jgi:hypothetical protein
MAAAVVDLNCSGHGCFGFRFVVDCLVKKRIINT